MHYHNTALTQSIRSDNIVNMNGLIKKIKRLARQVRGLFPSRLPQGMDEFSAWADSIQNTYTLPTVDTDSIRFVLASIILRLGPTAAYASKFYFALSLKAAGTKQVAGAQFQEIKLRQQEAQKQKQAEATAQDTQVSSGAEILRNS